MSLLLRVVVNAAVLCIIKIILSSNWEVNSMIVGLSDYLPKERALINYIHEFEDKRISELRLLQKKINSIEEEHERALEDLVEYLSNPINAYKLVKRIVVDWNEIHDFISAANTTRGYIKSWNDLVQRIDPPNEYNLSAAIDELVKTGDDGAMGSIRYGSDMGWDECYEVGVRLYDRQEYVGAISWLETAMQRSIHEDAFDYIRLDILEYIAHSQHFTGREVDATSTLLKARKLEVPGSTVAEELAYFKLIQNSANKTLGNV